MRPSKSHVIWHLFALVFSTKFMLYLPRRICIFLRDWVWRSNHMVSCNAYFRASLGPPMNWYQTYARWWWWALHSRALRSPTWCRRRFLTPSSGTLRDGECSCLPSHPFSPSTSLSQMCNRVSFFLCSLVVTRVTSDISAWKRLNVLVNMDKKALTDRTRGRQIITARKPTLLLF